MEAMVYPTISNAFNARSTSCITLAEEGVPIFESHKRFSPWAISLGVEKLKHNLLSSSVISFPSMIERLKPNENARITRYLY